jgi:hypothetical protein
MARSRAGRKPKGAAPRRVQICIRMEGDLHTQLKAAVARKPGRTLSDELHARLRRSFSREREEQGDPATRALTFLISTLAHYTHMRIPNWHRNPFLFRAFRLAVDRFLATLEPPGELRPPYQMQALGLVEQEQTPNNAALVATLCVLRLLDAASPEELGPNLRRSAEEHRDVLDILDRDYYGMANVKRDLGIWESKKGD